jgi:hypothetical protein
MRSEFSQRSAWEYWLFTAMLPEDVADISKRTRIN